MGLNLDKTEARDAATTLRLIAASAFNVPAGHLTAALNALETGAIALTERASRDAEMRALHRVLDVARSHVHAEELDSSRGAATWSDLRDAIAACDRVTGRR
jgi:hypothetical protein